MNPMRQAEHDAEGAIRLALIRGILNLIRREPNELLPFDAVKALKPHGEHYLGLQAIEVAQIIGSTDRYKDFDQVFLPRNEHLVDRWVNIRRLHLEGKELPPIQVYKVGDTYFVKDGNHRVSVAHLENQMFIDAEVIELDVTVPPTAGDNVRDLILKGEYASFLVAAKLDDVRPDHYAIMFSTLGRYDLLLEHISTRRYYLGLRYQREVSWAEAVGSWYDRLYKRMVDEIRASHSLIQFPTRTEADLYLWMMDHRYYLNQRYGRDPGSRETVLEFTRNYRPSWWRRFSARFGQRLRESLDGALAPGLSAPQRAVRLFTGGKRRAT